MDDFRYLWPFAVAIALCAGFFVGLKTTVKAEQSWVPYQAPWESKLTYMKDERTKACFVYMDSPSTSSQGT